MMQSNSYSHQPTRKALITAIQRQGFVQQVAGLSSAYVHDINQHIDDYLDAGHPGIVFEKDGTTPRGIHGLQLFDDFFERLIRHPNLLGLAQEYLGEPVYAHQLKGNVKQRMNGQYWPWHQDHIYWQKKDGVPVGNKILNIGIFLDDVAMLHGPLCFIPCSHLLGELCDIDHSSTEKNATDSWRQDVSENLTWQISHQRINDLLLTSEPVFATGKAGDVLAFDPKTAHCSSVNLSPQDRRLLIITYNAVSNKPVSQNGDLRPAFLATRDYTPLEVVDIDATG